MRELSDDDALWIGQGVPLMDSRNAETIALVRAGYRAAQAMTEGPAADPIADLCARLRDEYDGCPSPVTTARVATLREAADALERLRAERAEAERDALRAQLREIARLWDMPSDAMPQDWRDLWRAAIDAARKA